MCLKMEDFSQERRKRKKAVEGGRRGERSSRPKGSSTSSKVYMIYNSTSPSPSPAKPCLHLIPGVRTGLEEYREGEMRRRKRPWQGS